MRIFLVAAGLLLIAGSGYVAFGVLRDSFTCTAAERAPLDMLALAEGGNRVRDAHGRCVVTYETREDKSALYERYAGDLSADGWAVSSPPAEDLVSGPLLTADKDGLNLSVVFTSPEAYGTSDPPTSTRVDVDVRRRSLSEPRVESCYDHDSYSRCGY